MSHTSAEPLLEELATVRLQCKLDVAVLKLPPRGERRARQHDTAYFNAVVAPLILNQARVQYAATVSRARGKS